MLNTIWDTVKSVCRKVREWFSHLDKPTEAKVLIAGTTVASALIGGAVFQYAATALLTNALFWYEFKDSPRVMAFLDKYGKYIDGVISVLSVVSSGATLGGFLTGLMFGSYFTLFRFWLLPDRKKAVKIVRDENVGGEVAEGVIIEEAVCSSV